MRTNTFPIVMALFGVPWIIFGIQHFMYAGFVSGLVPSYMPARIFWVYFTAVAMIAAGISFIIYRQVQPAAFLLGCMLLLFILMLHTLLLSKEPQMGQHWTRVMQDTAIMGAAFGLAVVWGRRRAGAGQGAGWWRADAGQEAGGRRVEKGDMDAGQEGGRGWRAWVKAPAVVTPVIARCCYALPLVVLGAQHFTHNAFVTAAIPSYFPARPVFDYLIGAVLIAAAYGILSPRSTRWTAIRLGVLLMILLLLYHIPLLVADVHNAIQWTGTMLDLALAAGAFIIAETADP